MGEYYGMYNGISVMVLEDGYFLTGYRNTYIPRRKHRKRRIQKKWIKRYGYIYEPVYDFTKGWLVKTPSPTLLISRAGLETLKETGLETLKEICKHQEEK